MTQRRGTMDFKRTNRSLSLATMRCEGKSANELLEIYFYSSKLIKKYITRSHICF